MQTFAATDDKGRKIECVLEHAIPIDGVNYALLTPNDTPVVLVRIGEGGGDDKLIENWENAEDVLAAADQRLAEYGLILVRSAVTLTVAGPLLPVEGENVEGIEIEDDTEGGTDLFELLISFRCDGSLHGLYIPLDPFFVVARMTSDNEGLVVTGDEFNRVQPIIEAELDKRKQGA
jgi:hypothetical protein